jgi:hypothetical protein
MRLWKKIALVLLILFVVSQIPFCYRRLQLGAVDGRIRELNANRIEVKREGFKHYKGVIHVHTQLGGHSVGTFNELIEAAQSNELDFVLLTEHPSPLYDTAKQTLNGKHGGVLFVGGNEVSSKQGDRFLLLPGDAESYLDTTRNTQDLINRQKQTGGLALITYPDKFRSWHAEGFDGIEVYSLHTNAKNFPRLLTFFDFFWSYWAYPELMIARNFERPEAVLQKYDELTASGKKLTLFGASDAHSNIGLSFSDRANHDLLKIHLDPYASIFKLVRLHVWLPDGKELTQENLLEAIKNGDCYMAFDVLGSSDGFSFTFADNRLKANAPLKCRFVLFKDGAKVSEFAETNEMIFETKETGVYRVEAYLDSLNFAPAPWIISNPIHIKHLSIAP